jgi:xanthine dehydrogenase accessory factor
LELALERLESAEQSRLLLKALAERRILVRRLCLNTGEVSLHPGGPEEGFSYDGDYVAKSFGPRWQLLVIGASHVARYLTPIAQSLDYRVILCEPRVEHAEAWDLPDTELEPGMPDDAVQTRADDPRSAVVALTHDPKLDDMALMTALAGRAFYVGALGSAGNNAKRRQRLLQLGLDEAQVGRLRGPVGLPLGGRTPPEIAVSIAADLTAVRHGRVLRIAESG